MKTFTTFCRDTDVGDSTWIEAVIATSPDRAQQIARIRCSRQWEIEEDAVECFCVVEGTVNILHWKH